MKALTLWQPWASLVALGVKTIETRGKPTRYRGPLAIHAAARRFGFDSPTAELIRSWPLDVWRRVPRPYADAELCDNYPLGAVVATCTLADCIPTESAWWCDADQWADDAADAARLKAAGWGRDGDAYWLEVDQRPYGDYTPGRYAWLLEDIDPLPEPVPAKGYQGLWEWTPPGDEGCPYCGIIGGHVRGCPHGGQVS